MVFQDRVYSVLIVTASDRFTNSIMPLLPMTDYWPVKTAAGVAEARRRLAETEFDIVLINTPLPDDFGMHLAIDICAGSGAGVLLLVKSDHYNEIYSKVVRYGVITLAKPTTRQGLYIALRALTALRSKLLQMEQKNRALQQKVADIHTVNRAKWLLIQQDHMTENDAHRFIEKQAMDMRLSRREVAESIIRTYDTSV